MRTRKEIEDSTILDSQMSRERELELLFDIRQLLAGVIVGGGFVRAALLEEAQKIAYEEKSKGECAKIAGEAKLEGRE